MVYKLLALAALLLLPIEQGRSFGAARPGRSFGTGVTITAAPEGGFVVGAPSYRALIGPDGNLHSLRIADSELLDDRVAISLGAFYYLEAPLKLSSVAVTGAATVEANDSIHAIRYRFEPDRIQLTLSSTSPAPLPYFVVLSPEISIVKNLATKEAASAPAEGEWPNVAFYTAAGTYLQATGGTRVWGAPWLGRQVWEVGGVAAGHEVQVTLAGGAGEPPKPTLEQLIGVRAEVQAPDGLIPASQGMEIKVSVENRSEEDYDGLVAMELSGCRTDFAVFSSTPLHLAARRTSEVKLPARLNAPDFYRARITAMVQGREAGTAIVVAGYRADEIVAAGTRPEDFSEFWQRLVAEVQQGNPTLALSAPPRSLEGGIAIAPAQFTGLGGKVIHGWFLFPEDQAQHAAILYLPGYGARPVEPPAFLAERGYVVLAIDVRGNPVDQPRLRPFEYYSLLGIESPDTYVYREIVGHVLLALRALAARPEVDPGRIAVLGVSEGGGLGLIAAALDPKVRAVSADAPMLCDFPLSLRAAIWPYAWIAAHMRDNPGQAPQIARTLSYFDAANFAPDIHTPVLVSVGFLDKVSLPAAVYGVYNLLAGPKEMRPFPKAGHEGGGDELWAHKLTWLAERLAPAPPR
jgi:cephalosporin-C deacetylase